MHRYPVDPVNPVKKLTQDSQNFTAGNPTNAEKQGAWQKKSTRSYNLCYNWSSG